MFCLCSEKRPKLKEGLSGTCVQACSFAKSTVLSLCDRYISGEVSVNEVKATGRNVNHLCVLLQASSGIDKNKALITTTALQSSVKDRREELSFFSHYQTVLAYLCDYICDVQGRISVQV